MDEFDKYTEAFNNCGLKVGDKVLMFRNAYTHEDGWGNSWTSSMNKYVGNIHIIKRISDSEIFLYDVDFGFPYFIFKKSRNLKIKKLLE